MVNFSSKSFQVLLLTLGCFFSSSILTTASYAQVTADDTVNTQVNQNGNVSEITGGETRESNLFHSFQDFSISTGNEVFFNNASNISNIFSRVTGGDISNIDGLIRANGDAHLFLINPAGIIFGENARLDIGGSFYGSTASSILFDDGEFSAVDNLDQPILTVNAPIGLGFRDDPGDIVNRSRVQNSVNRIVGLEINSGQNLAFIGGDINFESGYATAPGGNIYLGGLAETGIVNLNENGSLNFPQNLTLSNINLTNNAQIDVRGLGGGNVTVDSQNLTIKTGQLGNSLIIGGINFGSTNPEAQAGDITINVAENIRLDESGISNQVAPESIGNSGNIIINTNFLELINGGQIDASTLGTGNGGSVNITATGDITADGENSQGIPSSGITSGIDTGAEGDSGGINISTTNLNLTDGGRVITDTFGTGNAGEVNITATGNITADGEDSNGIPSGITSAVNTSAKGDAGGVSIFVTNLNLTNGGRVDASTLGTGNAGSVNITATEDITVDGENSQGIPSGITSAVDTGAEGDSGGVTISTTNLNLTDGGRVITSTVGTGNASDVRIDASESISIDGRIARFRSGISANAINESGNGGDIFVTTGNLTIANGGTIEATNFDNIVGLNPGTGRPGNIEISANTIDLTDNARIEAATQFEGEATGIINLNVAKDITLKNNSFISAQAFGNADGGNLTIDARFILGFASGGTGNDLLASAEKGDGGNINLNIEQLFGFGSQQRGATDENNNFLTNNTNDLDVSGSVEGDLNINTANVDPLQGTTELAENLVTPEETSQQACEANKESAAKNGLNITGKGGIIPDPKLPLNSLNLYPESEPVSTPTIPTPIQTSKGKIKPARGIKITEFGDIILTAYRTNNAGERITETRNCR